MKESNPLLLLRNFSEARDRFFKPLCQELKLSKTSLEILLLLDRWPQWDSAKDVVKYGGIKPGIVSDHVERLVAEGYLERSPVAEDRRRIRLVLTQKTAPVVARGRELQRHFCEYMTRGLTEADRKHFYECLQIVALNAEQAVTEPLDSLVTSI